jgi:hypothetical protein
MGRLDTTTVQHRFSEATGVMGIATGSVTVGYHW